MEITYYGRSCFKIRGKNTTVVTDPFDPDFVGLKPFKYEADIVTISHHHKDHDYITESGSAFVVGGPGEYKIKNVDILGIKTFHDQLEGSQRGKNTVYEIRLEGVSFVHLGDLGHKLSDETAELLGGVDVLFVPVGGVYTVDPHEALEIIAQLEPKIVLPMHYASGTNNNDHEANLLPLENFLKEIGKEETVQVEKLLVTREKLPEEMQVVVLKV